MAKQKQTIEEKVQKKYPEFIEEVQGLMIPDLEKRLNNHSKAASDWEQKKEEDDALATLKEQVSELNAVYAEPIKELKLKCRYLASLIKEKGGQ